MFIALLLVVAATTSAPAPPAQSQSFNAPLRTLTYKVSVTLQTNQISESYGGYGSQNTGGWADTIGAAPSSTGSRGGRGEVTVTVMAAGPDGSLAVRVREQWDGVTQAQPYDGVVEPNGSVDFPASTITDATREILQYFGTKFVPSSGLTPTTHWSTVQKYADAEVDSDYSITGVANGVASLQKKQAVKPLGVDVFGTVQYDAPNLAPVSGHVTQMIHNHGDQAQAQGGFGGGQSDQDVKLIIDFTRLSDSRIASQSQP